jgi:hypothetical protein
MASCPGQERFDLAIVKVTGGGNGAADPTVGLRKLFDDDELTAMRPAPRCLNPLSMGV